MGTLESNNILFRCEESLLSFDNLLCDLEFSLWLINNLVSLTLSSLSESSWRSGRVPVWCIRLERQSSWRSSLLLWRKRPARVRESHFYRRMSIYEVSGSVSMIAQRNAVWNDLKHCESLCLCKKLTFILTWKWERETIDTRIYEFILPVSVNIQAFNWCPQIWFGSTLRWDDWEYGTVYLTKWQIQATEIFIFQD